MMQATDHWKTQKRNKQKTKKTQGEAAICQKHESKVCKRSTHNMPDAREGNRNEEGKGMVK